MANARIYTLHFSKKNRKDGCCPWWLRQGETTSCTYSVPTYIHTFSTQVHVCMVRAPPVYLLHNMDIHVPTYLEMYLHTQTLHTSYMSRYIIQIVCSTSYNRYITGSLLKSHVFNRPCSVSLPILRPSTTSTTFSNGLKQQFSFGGTASYHARSDFLKGPAHHMALMKQRGLAVIRQSKGFNSWHDSFRRKANAGSLFGFRT